MRFLSICLLILFSYNSSFSGTEISIISSGSFKGLADPDGEILIPAIYDGIGWSDGTVQLENDVIGYLDAGNWGLINTKNKKITKPIYHSLFPLGEELFLASKKARLTNHLFYGLINQKGDILIDFKYFSINRLSPEIFLVADYRDGEVLHGVLNIEDEEVIPCDFRSINLLENLIICHGSDKLVRIFDLNGNQLYDGWLDQVNLHPKGYEIIEEGKRGLLSKDLQLISKPSSKGLAENGEAHSFNRWEVRSLSQDSTFFQSCDSITILNEKLWIAHVNDAEHMLGAHEKLFSNQKYLLKYIHRGFIVAQNKHSGKWGLYKTNGDAVEEGYDYIFTDSSYFFGRRDNSWDIYNSFSRKMNKQPLEDLKASIARSIPVKKNGFWGFIDFMGEPIVAYKYDQILPGIGNQYLAKYVDKWGIANLPESWVALPEFDTIEVHSDYYLGKKGMATYIFDPQGDLIIRTGYDVFISEGIIYLREGFTYGIITQSGTIIHPEYNSIRKVGDFYVCKKDSVLEMLNPFGRKVLTEKDEVQEVFGYSEGYFHILKSGKHGFVDENGKLRIANRYDGALPYKEGLAAVKLRGKWGYIDKYEILVVQPHYDTCSVFEKGLTDISINGRYGIINKEGDVIIDPDFNLISRTTYGNYVMTDGNKKQGLADENGKILLRTNYDEVIDTPYDFVIARLGENYGVVTYQGYSYVPFNYKQVEVQGDYLLLLEN
ncbi:MAG: WG repeat-containing protein [Bacteroidota bacterium]